MVDKLLTNIDKFFKAERTVKETETRIQSIPGQPSMEKKLDLCPLYHASKTNKMNFSILDSLKRKQKVNGACFVSLVDIHMRTD